MSAVDFGYLEGYLGSDRRIVAEVLQLFSQQARGWAQGLTASNPDWRAVAHTVKGAALGVGAGALGEACHAAEVGTEAELPAARSELERALAEIAAYLAGS